MAKRVRVTMMLAVDDPTGDGAELQDELQDWLTRTAKAARPGITVDSCVVSVWEIASEGEGGAVRH